MPPDATPLKATLKVLPGTILIPPGARFLAMALTALPAAVVGLAASSFLERTSGFIAVAWLSLVPAALYRPRAALALPFIAGAFLLFTVLALPFNSLAFVVDFWTSVLMLILALPRR
jgi:hypothetical protein